MDVTFQFTPDQDRMLTALAEAEGISKNEAAVIAIADRVSRMTKNQQVRSLARAAIEQNGPLLDRLAE